jgi:hypothetical protein
MEITLARPVDVAQVTQLMRERSPAGLVIASVTPVDQKAPKPKIDHMTYQLTVPADRAAGLAKAIDNFLSAPEWPIVREGSTVPVDIRPEVLHVFLDGDVLEFQVRVSPTFTVRPREVLASLQIDDLETHGHWLRRTDVQLAAEEDSAGRGASLANRLESSSSNANS